MYSRCLYLILSGNDNGHTIFEMSLSICTACKLKACVATHTNRLTKRARAQLVVPIRLGGNARLFCTDLRLKTPLTLIGGAARK